MGVYLGKILVRNYYVNFKPLQEYVNGEFTELDYYMRQALLPDSQNGQIWFYSSNQSLDVNEMFSDNEFVLFEFEFEELEINLRRDGEINQTGYKINLYNLPDKRIQYLPDVNYYYLVEAENIEGDYKTNPALIITDQNVRAGMKVMLQIPDNSNILIGPLEVNWREYDRQCIVRTDFNSQNYLVWGYNYKDGFMAHTRVFDSFDPSLQYILVAEDICSKVALDVLPTELLIKDFQSAIGQESYEEGKIDFSNSESLIERYRSALGTGNSVPPDIQEQRLDAITALLTSEENISTTFGFIGETIGSFLLKYQDTEGYSKLIERIAKSSDFKDKIPQLTYVSRQISEKEAELNQLTQEIEALRKDIADQKAEEVAATFIEERQAEIQRLTEKIENLKAEIVTSLETLKDIKTVSDLQSRTEFLSKEISHQEWHKDQLSAGLQVIENRIDLLFANSAEKAMNFAFDGMLANKMLQQAAEWENLQTIKNYESVVEGVQRLQVSNKSKQELLDYLVNSIRKYRPSYDKNAIVNLLICISQGFLTVFSGEPGTGKTSICKIISGVLGLNHPGTIIPSSDGIDRNRFINVSVERGWTTKRDFIGYYNPLTKTFDQANRKVFDGLNLLDIEAKKGYDSFPFFILLDEANLSPMEYYWADYMNVCDDLDQNSNINLGGDYCFRVPSHLRFLATINNDHTTESLSPRLIDRAWIIRLPKVKAGASSPLPLIYDGTELISWKAMIDLFGSSSQSIEPMPEDIGKIYDTLLTKLREARITISTRSDGAIRRYCQVAQKLFETDVNYGNPPSLVALDYAIAQKILPHINGSGEKFGESLKQILSFLNEKNLRYSSEILAEIIQKGDDMMSYYQFFA